MRSLAALVLVFAVPALAQPVVEAPPPPPPPPAPELSPPPAPPSAPAPVVSRPAPSAPLLTQERNYTLLDLGVTGGFNNPGGIYGFETDFRAMTGYLSFGLSGGNGAWGVRVSPHVRAYPFGLDVAGLFVESAFSLNFGGVSESKVNGVVLESAERFVTPVVHVGGGWRQTLNRFTWLLFRVGYGFKLGGDQNYRWLAGNGEQGLGAVLALSQPGGFSIGLSAGFSFL